MFCHAHDPLSLASVLLMVDSYHVPNQEMEMTVTDDRSTTHGALVITMPAISLSKVYYSTTTNNLRTITTSI